MSVRNLWKLCVLVAALAVVAASGYAPSTTSAADDWPNVPLFLTDRFTPTQSSIQGYGGLRPNQRPEMVHMLPGEKEGFILAFKPGAGANCAEARIVTSTLPTGVNVEFLRVGFVNITKPSRGMASRTGQYPDPLPPQTGQPGVCNSTKLSVNSGRWAAFAVIVEAPKATTPGTYSAVVEILDQNGNVHVEQAFKVKVFRIRNKRGRPMVAMQPGAPRAYRAVVNFNPGWYRDGVNLLGGDIRSNTQEVEMTTNLLRFLSERFITPQNWSRAYPNTNGTYNCSDFRPNLDSYLRIPYWATGKSSWASKLLPNYSPGVCNGNRVFTIKNDRGTPDKYDDVLNAQAPVKAFIANQYKHFNANGFTGNNTYMLSPFDEPSGAQMNGPVRVLNAWAQAVAPKVKMMVTTWPMEKFTRKLCKTISGKLRCVNITAQADSNVVLWNGGADDADVFIVPQFRQYGFETPSAWASLGYSRTLEVHNRLTRVRSMAGKEVWVYNFAQPTRRVPQLNIDGPGVDGKLIFWQGAKEGNRGWYTAVSNRWIDPVNTTVPRNPYTQPQSYISPTLGNSNGWGSLYYPGYNAAYGLVVDTAEPVSSLRLENMRDGMEDANLIQQYRERYGNAAVARQMARIFGAPTVIREIVTNETWPTYRLSGMSVRLELQRRAILTQMARPV